MQTTYSVKTDGDSVLIGVPVTNINTYGSGPVSVVFDAFDGNLTLTANYKDVGTYTVGTRTWDGFSLKAGETQVIYLKFTVADVYNLPVTITGTITNAVDGNDAAGTAISITIENEDREDNFVSYAFNLTQTGTDAPVATGMSNTTGATFTIARSNIGIYTITADAGTPFAAGKTAVITGGVASGTVSAALTSTSVITITTKDNAFANADVLLLDTFFEIRIYGTPVLL